MAEPWYSPQAIGALLKRSAGVVGDWYESMPSAGEQIMAAGQRHADAYDRGGVRGLLAQGVDAESPVAGAFAGATFGGRQGLIDALKKTGAVSYDGGARYWVTPSGHRVRIADHPAQNIRSQADVYVDEGPAGVGVRAAGHDQSMTVPRHGYPYNGEIEPVMSEIESAIAKVPPAASNAERALWRSTTAQDSMRNLPLSEIPVAIVAEAKKMTTPQLTTMIDRLSMSGDRNRLHTYTLELLARRQIGMALKGAE